MLDWLTDTSTPAVPVSAAVMAFRLIAACWFGFVVAVAYRLHRHPTPIPATFPLTLVLLSILIAMVMQVIDDRVARAFSLVGALSIVRFRTVLDETQDIAFVIFAVVVGMASGTGALVVAVLGTGVMIGTLCLARLPLFKSEQLASPVETPDANLEIRVAIGTDFDLTVAPVLASCVATNQLLSMETARGGSVLEWNYSVKLKPEISVTQIVDRLCKTEGVQNVNVRMRDSKK